MTLLLTAIFKSSTSYQAAETFSLSQDTRVSLNVQEEMEEIKMYMENAGKYTNKISPSMWPCVCLFFQE